MIDPKLLAPLFEGLGALAGRIPQSEWPAAMEILSTRTIGAGETFCKAGDPATELAFLSRGLAKKYYLNDSGEEFIKGFSREGDFLGPYADMLRNVPSGFFIEALEPCQLLVFSYQDLQRLFERHMCWQELGRVIAERLFIDHEIREYELLAMSPTDRYLAFVDRFPQLEKRVPLKLIARYLGIHPVSLSRIRSRKAPKKKKT